MYCEECGAEIAGENAYCICCGARAGSGAIVPREKYRPRHAQKASQKWKWVLFCTVMLAVGAAAESLVWSHTGVRLGEKQFARGYRHLIEGTYAEALESFSHSIDNGYAAAKVYLELAQAHLRKHDDEGAIHALEEGMAAVPLDEKPLLADILFGIYKDRLMQGYYPAPADLLTDVIGRYDAETCRLLAESFSDFGDAGQAIELLAGTRGALDPEKVDTIIEALRFKAGNTPGNTSNGGIVAQQGEWLYYVSDWDFMLYKAHPDGKGWAQVCDDEITNLSVMGEYIYYRNWTEEGALYKIRTDGTGRQRLTFDQVYNPIVSNGWIYYYNDSDNGYLYKVRTDGRGRTRLNGDPSHYANLAGDWIYYTDLYDIYKVRTDGMEPTRVMDCGDGCGFLIVDGDWMYYYDGIDYGRICKARTDGTEQTVLSRDLCEFFNVAGGWIYYSNYSDGKKLYKMRTDGTERTQIGDSECMEICIVEDWIYYGDEYDYYRIRFDGSQVQKAR